MSGRSRSQSRADQRRRRWRWGIGAAVVALLAVGGVLLLPDDDDAPDRPALAVSMIEYAYEPAVMEAAPGQEIAVRNDGAIVHNLVSVELGKGVELQPGASGTFVVPDDAEGTYRIICDLPGHVDQGMVGTLIVE